MLLRIPIGWRESYYLVLNIDIYTEDKACKLSVPIPDNYPQTAVSIALKDKGFFESTLYVDGYQFSATEREDFLEKYNIDLDRQGLYLQEFYVLSRKEAIPETEEEQRMLRGLGKRCLSLAVPILVDYFKLNMDDILFLGASSTGKRNDRELQQIEELSMQPKSDLVSQFMLREGFSPSMLDKDETSRQTYLEELEYLLNKDNKHVAARIVDYDNTQQLVRYYESMGFHRTNAFVVVEFDLVTSIGEFIATNCQ